MRYPDRLWHDLQYSLTQQKRLEELKRQESEDRLSRMNNNKGKTDKSTPKKNKNKMNGEGERKSKKRNDLHIIERAHLVLWRSPIQTLLYFVFEILCLISDAKDRLLRSMFPPRDVRESHPYGFIFFVTTVGVMVVYNVNVVASGDGMSDQLKEDISWYSYWVFLGILSSVGLGTGLHTFLLYLGPFIAKVTIAAQECGSVQFPKPPYPEQVLCPAEGNEGTEGVSFAIILAKIRWESLMWGFGTALGELPPYFMARAARLSGMDDDEDLQEFAQLLRQKHRQDGAKLSLLDRGKLWMEDIVEKVGFWGILACASIPNPLFDLAGITCGHFLVPFTTFFGATVIGKAVVKAHLQMMFVILAFNDELLQSAASLLRSLPRVGPIISEPFVEFINLQKLTLHKGSQGEVPTERGILGFILENLVLAMIIYFVVSIINATAQAHHKRRSTKLKH